MSNYIQKSYKKKFGNRDNSMETKIIEDLEYIFSILNAGGDETVLGSSTWANGFILTSCIGEDITLPPNATFEYNGPLTLCDGATLTISEGTTLTII